MSQLPLSIGTLHFSAIGGIGMSGIAEILHETGYSVTGSDIAENANIRRLREKGITITIGQTAESLGDAAILVISTAIPADNPELLEARRRFLPIVHRAEMLGELMRLRFSVAIAGTHGKTTTTSLVATLLEAGGIDPTVINGGIITGWGSNAKLGKSDWMVVEPFESDGSFERLNPTVAIVTNIDPEHLDHHGSFEALQEAFRHFVASIPFYGFAALCMDHPIVQRLIPKIAERRLVTYGTAATADVRAVNIATMEQNSTDAAAALQPGCGGGMCFDVQLSDRMSGTAESLTGITLPMLGEHNVLNCLAAITVALEMGIQTDQIKSGLQRFRGVGRRFEQKYTRSGHAPQLASGGSMTIIDDYGHHPVEIKAALAAARMLAGKAEVVAVMQPHRYSRLSNLFEEFCGCFNDADRILIADVYAAGEQPVEGASQNDLIDGLIAYGHPAVEALPTPDALAPMIHAMASAGELQEGAVVICLGAGSITGWAAALPDQLETLRLAEAV